MTPSSSTSGFAGAILLSWALEHQRFVKAAKGGFETIAQIADAGNSRTGCFSFRFRLLFNQAVRPNLDSKTMGHSGPQDGETKHCIL